MPAFDLTMTKSIPTFQCNDCGTEFSIVMINRPSLEHLAEYPDSTGTHVFWDTKAKQQPRCPDCGKLVTRTEE